jgi:hypothetical protein
MELLSKECTKCKESKPLTAEFFPLHNKTKSGFDSWCRVCRGNYRNEIRRGNYRKMISDEDLKNLIDTTKECIICGSKENLVVDHCHEKNIIRGMLCNNCNMGLGHFKDDPELLEFARIYLINYSDNPSEADEYLDKNKN